ncbi:DUF4091 domain-containing protein [Paenibacillus piri]|uniref:DUF4091 domain-containing protein n=1 Tax=Paenibacillus piri TaxID=2547395 RepID=A0A4R5KBS5_9BACL|nr:DUF4091 domain-containing protein [Paenibacillus piri]TDF92536.1 DUF4091 domain-containing protein [Paenibacillus piri]
MYFGLQSMYYKYAWGVNYWDQNDKDTSVKHMNMVSCRNDSAAMQVVVGADHDLLLTVSEEPLFWKGGPMQIARIKVRMNEADAPEASAQWIGLMKDDDGAEKADVLQDSHHVFVPRRKLQPVWVEWSIGKRARPGIYTGTVMLYTHTMFDDELPAGELSFTLKVLEHTLPDAQDYRFYLDLWQHNANIARKYDVPLWSEAHFSVMKVYLESLARLGQKAASAVVSEIPWSGQKSHIDAEPSDLFEYSMIQVTRDANGVFRYNYAALDRYIELAAACGITEEIELFGLLSIWQPKDGVYGSPLQDYPDAIRVRYYDEATANYKFIRQATDIEQYIGSLHNHLTAKGWIHKVRIMADEPDNVELFQERVRALRRVAPSFKFKVAIDSADLIEAKLEGIHDYVPKLDCAMRQFARIRELAPEVPGRMLFYVCGSPKRPNTFIGSPGIEARIIPWLAEWLGLDGFLRWNYTAWPDRPLERIGYRPTNWPAGDMNFVYPGPAGKPLLSLRYKWLQRGVRDAELMRQLREAGLSGQVDELLDGVFRADAGRGPESFNPERPAHELYSLEPADYDRLFLLAQSMGEPEAP